MLTNPVITQSEIFSLVWFVVAVLMGILFFLYFIFSLIVVRQVRLMTDTLITQISPVLRALSVIHAIIALGILVFYLISVFNLYDQLF